VSTTLTSESTKRVRDKEKDTLLGLEHALFAAARVFAPYLGGSVLKQGGISLVAVVTGGVFLGVYVLWTLLLSSLLPPLSSADTPATAAGTKKKLNDGGGVNKWKEK
jgi:hypothetical protein